MSLTKETKDKKVNFEFNKEFINLFSKKIKDSDTNFLNRTLKELHPSDSADIIENLIPENRSKLIELESFSLDPEIFIELNESIQTEIFILLSIESIVTILKRLESDNALKILENLIPENRSKLIELEGFNLDPEIFIELNESIQTEIFILLSIESIVNILKRLESDNALKII